MEEQLLQLLFRRWAEGHASVPAVVYLIDVIGADVNAKAKLGNTMLHVAALYGQRAAVDLQLGRGADVHAKNNNGDTVLHWAAANGHLAVVELLLETGADVNVQSNKGFTALHWAAHKGHLAVVELLVKKGADVHAKNEDDWTALHVAAREDHLAVVELLVEKGADVNAKGNEDETALHIAAEWGRSAVVEVLLKHERIEVNATDNHGETPLHWGAAGGQSSFSSSSRDHRGVVKLLATHGADVTAEDNDGWTPIHAAVVPGRDRNGDTVEPDIGIINYLLRETGAIVPLAQNVVGAHEQSLWEKYHPGVVVGIIERRSELAAKAAAAVAQEFQEGRLAPDLVGEGAGGAPSEGDINVDGSAGARPARRLVPASSWSDERVSRDLAQARQLVAALDAEKGIGFNPVQAAAAGGDQAMAGDAAAIGMLDLLLEWLWRVHRLDYYGGSEALDALEAPAGMRTVRPPRPHLEKSAGDAAVLGASFFDSLDSMWESRCRKGDPLPPPAPPPAARVRT